MQALVAAPAAAEGIAEAAMLQQSQATQSMLVLLA